MTSLHAMPQPQSGDQTLAQRVSAGLAANHDFSPGGAAQEAACNAPGGAAQEAVSCVLFYQAGTSDKEYHLALEPAPAGNDSPEALPEAPCNGWLVNALYGRRGGNLKPATKTAAPVDYSTALNIYERVKKEKLGEGYRESTAPVATFAPLPQPQSGDQKLAQRVSAGLAACNASPEAACNANAQPQSGGDQKLAQRVSAGLAANHDSSPGGAAQEAACNAPSGATQEAQGVEVELLTPIEIADVGKYILDDRYWIQEKADGDRSPVRRSGNTFIRYNRKGQPKPLPSSLAAALSTTLQTEWLLDGEIEGEQLWIFSALESGGTDLRSLPFAERYRHAEHILAHVAQPPSAVILLPVAKTAEEKEAFIRRMIAENAEGVVIVDSHAPFKPGRAGQHFKLKFVKTCTVRATFPHKDGKRSVGMELYEGDPAIRDCWHDFGSVSIPAKYGPLPEPGTLLEVRYLYAHRAHAAYGRAEQGGALNQPVYLRRRDDLDPSAATVSQLTFKRGEE